ncbi:hypothetical protein GCM10025868_20150 [Angustibacter aerolatus]|uniref:Uncharacterized protein n=1 Tax=Angustibacter aerolatus TaxID=1162965 RepID=A0ABQ6JHR0_9ACTN|nr:hypothetical protein [Angustibacter aerolatus]GMA86765.1 hypothetical protein GCM10025868_20150 [Angustibacter aerolatus]
MLCFAALHGAVLLRPHGSAILVAVAFVVLVPGAVLLRALDVRPRGTAERLVLSVSGSLAVLLLVTLGVNTVGPAQGLNQPLSTLPLLIALDGVTVLLAIVATLRRASHPVPVPQRVSPLTAMLLLPVLVGVGTQVLEQRGTTWVVAAGLGLGGLALVWAAFAAKQGRDGAVQVVLFSVVLALLWSYSLRSKGLYGFDVQQEFAAFRTTAEALRWHPVDGDSYSAMLSITALPTALWRLTALSPLGVFACCCRCSSRSTRSASTPPPAAGSGRAPRCCPPACSS